MNVLLVVDPQIDFISGSLPVPNAAEAMDRLAQWIDQYATAYDAIVITMDQHPIGHCSFVAQGGRWPVHCVRYSPGAAIYPAVLSAVMRQAAERAVPVHFIEKATSLTQDEYSAFSKTIPEVLLQAERIYLAGLAGDYCVQESQRDLETLIPSERIMRLEQCIAYITPPVV